MSVAAIAAARYGLPQRKIRDMLADGWTPPPLPAADGLAAELRKNVRDLRDTAWTRALLAYPEVVEAYQRLWPDGSLERYRTAFPPPLTPAEEHRVRQFPDILGAALRCLQARKADLPVAASQERALEWVRGQACEAIRQSPGLYAPMAARLLAMAATPADARKSDEPLRRVLLGDAPWYRERGLLRDTIIDGRSRRIYGSA